MIKECNCKSKQQDKLHGKNNRVFNKTQKKKGLESKYYRCTVCGEER